MKDDAYDELTGAMTAALLGAGYVSARLRPAIDAWRQTHPAKNVLTPRELEILRLMADGLATKEVAHDLGLSIKTIETHRRNLMEKLGLESVADVTKYALRERLTTP